MLVTFNKYEEKGKILWPECVHLLSDAYKSSCHFSTLCLQMIPSYCYTFLKVNTTSDLLCLCDPEWKLGKIFMGLFPLIFYRIKSRVVVMLRVFS